MKPFSERNPLPIAAIGAVLTAAAVLIALGFDNLQFVSTQRAYHAEFAEAGGLKTGDTVRLVGTEVGKVKKIDLVDDHVSVDFTVTGDVQLGGDTEAAIKTASVLGARELALVSRGTGTLDGGATIPIARTSTPYDLNESIGELSSRVSKVNTDQLSDSFNTLSDTFAHTPESARQAIDGVARLSETLSSRDAALEQLLRSARAMTDVLAQRSGQIGTLITDADKLLTALNQRRGALDQILGNVTRLSTQLSGLVADNEATLGPTLADVNSVLTVVNDRKDKVTDAINTLVPYVRALGESVSSGPFFQGYVPNLIPGQWIQPFIDGLFPAGGK